MRKVLVATVGGSATPILAAIRSDKPDHVVFVCSPDSARDVRAPTLRPPTADAAEGDVRALPRQAGLADGQWEIVETGPDDPDAVVLALDAWRRRFAAEDAAGWAITADYTGGTKSMSAGLVLWASLSEGVRLLLSTGPRHDLRRVRTEPRTREMQTRSVGWAFLDHQVAHAWGRYDFEGAARLLSDWSGDLPERLERARLWSQGLAAWDAADWTGALAHLGPYGSLFGPYLARLRTLGASAPDDRSPTGATRDRARQDAQAGAHRAAELYLAAERRQRGGRHDVAVLLYYRFVEDVAAFTLRHAHDVDPSDVGDRADLANLVSVDHKGRKVLSMVRAWEAVRRLDGDGGPAQPPATQALQGFAAARNDSLLAHGHVPLGEAAACEARRFAEQEVLPYFLRRAGAFARLPAMPAQLPDRLPAMPAQLPDRLPELPRPP